MRKGYGIMMMGAVLLTGCSHNDATEATLEGRDAVAPTTHVAITFAHITDTQPYDIGAQPYDTGAQPYKADAQPNKTDAQNNEEFPYTITQDNYEDYPISRAGQTGLMDTEDLYTTGFGVFASHEPTGRPDLMYNQHVTFTHVGDMESLKEGYWSYAPLKYWPYDAASAYFCAYAPYVASATDDGTTAGIIGFSDNESTTPYISYRRALHPEETVDLLWSYVNPTEIAPLTLTMYHALARIRLSVKLTSTLPAGTKLLLTTVTLQGNIATKGRLLLNTSGDTPSWTVDPTDIEDQAVVIRHAPSGGNSYGIIDEGIRYIEDMPYRWQPDGLQKDVAMNILSLEDRPTYVYLIPQTSLRLSCKIEGLLLHEDGSPDTPYKTKVVDVDIPNNEDPFDGNNCYHLTFKINYTAP